MSAYLERLAAVERSLAEVTDARFGDNPFADVALKVCIAASARTGSNYLCQRLREVGIRAGEYFHSRRLRALLAKTGERLEDHCAGLVRRFAYRGTFAVKGAIDVLAIPHLCGELPANLASWRFVHLRRRDIVKQAISHVLARQSGEWRSPTPGTTADRAYDARSILALARQMIEVNALWEGFFTDSQVTPLRIWYEDLDASPETVCAAVARFAGIQAPPVPGAGPPLLARQANVLNAEWEARLRSDEAEAVAALEARWRALTGW